MICQGCPACSGTIFGSRTSGQVFRAFDKQKHTFSRFPESLHKYASCALVFLVLCYKGDVSSV
jgi:hypothetical protein